MKLEEIKDIYAVDQGFDDWNVLRDETWDDDEFENHLERVLILIQQEQQKLIAEKVKKLMESDEVGEIFIDDYKNILSSIINENNIIR